MVLSFYVGRRITTSTFTSHCTSTTTTTLTTTATTRPIHLPRPSAPKSLCTATTTRTRTTTTSQFSALLPCRCPLLSVSKRHDLCFVVALRELFCFATCVVLFCRPQYCSFATCSDIALVPCVQAVLVDDDDDDISLGNNRAVAPTPPHSPTKRAAESAGNDTYDRANASSPKKAAPKPSKTTVSHTRCHRQLH